MGVAKKLPKTKSIKDAVSFDDFLETLDDSDSEISDSEDSVLEEENDDDSGDVNEDEEQQDEEQQEEDLIEDEEQQEEDLIEDEEQQEEDLEITEEPKQNKSVASSLENESRNGRDNENEISDEEEDPEQQAADHKKALQRLQDTDPDFFAYLKENDSDLLNFEASDDDDGSSDEEPLHTAPEELEEASDSEAEEERVQLRPNIQGKIEKYVAKGIVNLEVVKDWGTKLSTSRELPVLVNVIEAFECAVQQILEDEYGTNQKWKVDGSANFNALVRLCIQHVKGFCVRYLLGSNNLAMSEQKFDQRPLEVKEKCSQKWSKLRSKLKSYMGTLVKFLKSMGNSEAVASILRHCQKMSGFWAIMATKSFKLVRTLINIWSSGEDSCRILAFLTTIRMANYNREVFLQRICKQMYLSYVANSKFTSVNTWPALNLLRGSLVEVYLLDPSLAYSVAFPFIRQLAIHLRNALTSGNSSQSKNNKQGKKETSRIVYSWQFVHSLHLWADLLAHSNSAQDENLKLLIYPVVQICLGTIKLIPTKKYIPLRFLIVRMLIKVQEKTGVFIPILPLITEVLLMTDFSSKTVSKFSVRPLDMTCCLKADANESGYAKAVSENVFELILRTCKAIATDLSFPEIVTPTLMQLRSFLKKKCKNPEVCRKFKSLIEKIDANAKYISDKRNKALEFGTLSLSDVESQKILRVQMETNKPHPPILEFATTYLKANAKIQEKLRKVNVETREEKLIPKPSSINSHKSKKSKADMFDSDDDKEESSKFKTKFDLEEDSEEIKRSKKKSKLKRKSKDSGSQDSLKSGKKGKKQKLISDSDAQDELVDLDFSD